MATKHIRRAAPTLAVGVTAKDAQRIQSAVAKQHDGKIPRGSYVRRIQRAVARQAKSS